MNFGVPARRGSVEKNDSTYVLRFPFVFLLDEDDKPPPITAVRICQVTFRSKAAGTRKTKVADFTEVPRIYSEDLDETGARKRVTSDTFSLRRDSAGKNQFFLDFDVPRSELELWIDDEKDCRLFVDIGFKFTAGAPEVIFRLALIREGDRSLRVVSVKRIKKPRLVLVNLFFFLFPLLATLCWNHLRNRGVHSAPLPLQAEMVGTAVGFVLGYFGLQLAIVLAWVSELRHAQSFFRLPELYLPPNTFQALRSPSFAVLSSFLYLSLGFLVTFHCSLPLEKARLSASRVGELQLIDSASKTVSSNRVAVRDLDRGVYAFCGEFQERQPLFPVGGVRIISRDSLGRSGGQDPANNVRSAGLLALPDMGEAGKGFFEKLQWIFEEPIVDLEWAKIEVVYRVGDDPIWSTSAREVLSRPVSARQNVPRGNEKRAIRQLLCGSGLPSHEDKFFARVLVQPSLGKRIEGDMDLVYRFLIDHNRTFSLGEASDAWTAFFQRQRLENRSNPAFEKNMSGLREGLLRGSFPDKNGTLAAEHLVSLVTNHFKLFSSTVDLRRLWLETALLLEAAAEKSKDGTDFQRLSPKDYKKLESAVRQQLEGRSLMGVGKHTYRALTRFFVAAESLCGTDFYEEMEPQIKTVLDTEPRDYLFHLIAVEVYRAAGLLSSSPSSCGDSGMREFFMTSQEGMAAQKTFSSRLGKMIEEENDPSTREYLQRLLVGLKVEEPDSPVAALTSLVVEEAGDVATVPRV